MESIERFCGLPSNDSYTVWEAEYGTFGKCFLWTAISYTSHVLLLITCAYLLGISRKTFINQKSKLLWIIDILTFLLATTSLIELILSYALKYEHPPAYVLSKTLSFSSWLVCFWVQYRSRVITPQKKQNNKCILFVFIFVIASTSMQLHYVIKHILSMKDVAFSELPADYFGVFVYFLLNCLYLLSGIILLFSKTKRTFFSRNVSIQNSDGSESQDESAVFYQKLKPENADIYLGKAEQGNPLSRLFFWWTNKLVLKGHYHQLQKPEDLFILPDDLGTKLIKETVSTIRHNQRLQSLLHMSTINDYDPHKKLRIKISMLKTFHKCFGKLYYSIGILKLLSDCFGFAGPILLNLLVRFMENKQVCIVITFTSGHVLILYNVQQFMLYCF